MKAYTDYPFIALGDEEGEEASVRECEILSYDGDKYCTVLVGGEYCEVKSCYLYSASGRLGEVPQIKLIALEGLYEN